MENTLKLVQGHAGGDCMSSPGQLGFETGTKLSKTTLE